MISNACISVGTQTNIYPVFTVIIIIDSKYAQKMTEKLPIFSSLSVPKIPQIASLQTHSF